MASTLTCVVPQGSVLGLALFIMYTEDLGEWVNAFEVLTLFFTDNSQLLACTTLGSAADVYRILEERSVSAVHDWCRLLLNPSKTEAIWFGSSADLDRLADADVTICLEQTTIHPSDCLRPGSPAGQFTVHSAAYCKGRVNVLCPPPWTVASPASGHMGTCPPGVWELFSLYVETSCMVWFGTMPNSNSAAFVQPYSIWNDTIMGNNRACAKVNFVFTARRYAL